jgi:hypothetical protein
MPDANSGDVGNRIIGADGKLADRESKSSRALASGI